MKLVLLWRAGYNGGLCFHIHVIRAISIQTGNVLVIHLILYHISSQYLYLQKEDTIHDIDKHLV